MQELIPFVSRQVGTRKIETVNGRDIYAFLGIARDYSDWVKRQIKSGQLIEDKDYTVFYNPVENSKGGRPSTEYHFTFRASEHIGMMSRTTKGKEIREYFLDLEEHFQQKAMLPQVQDPGLKMLIEMAVRTDEALTQAKQADARAIRAEAKADMALSEAHRMTVEHFIMSNGLLHQFPPAEHRRVSNWLKTFCLDYGLEVRKEPVYGKPWADENIYPLHAFSAWLRFEQLRPRQQTLRVIPQHDMP